MNTNLLPSGGSGFRSARTFLQAVLYLRAVVAAGDQQALDYDRDYIDPGSLCAEGEHPLWRVISRLRNLSRALEELLLRVGERRFRRWAQLESRPGTEPFTVRARQLGMANSTARDLVKEVYAELEGILGEWGWLEERKAEEIGFAA